MLHISLNKCEKFIRFESKISLLIENQKNKIVF